MEKEKKNRIAKGFPTYLGSEEMRRVSGILRIAWSIFKIAFILFFIWTIMKWNIRKARKSLERELIRAGFPRGEARKISRVFNILGDQVGSFMRSSLTFRIRG
ncbi:hypothetical protein J7L00_00855 [Candidatus Bathyarchaeota archaeon]|nr:hypothetical protein [Candidatus Bathyarchaeota archaeon]